MIHLTQPEYESLMAAKRERDRLREVLQLPERGWLLTLGEQHPAPHFQTTKPSAQQLAAATQNGWQWERVYTSQEARQ